MTTLEPFGKPGIYPRWTSSSKEGVGTSTRRGSSLYFTISHGIINEIYYPGLDTAQIRDHEFLVAGGDEFYEEKRNCKSKTTTLEDGIPAFKIVNTENDSKFTIEKTLFINSENDVLVEHCVFKTNKGSEHLSIYSLLSPHLNNGGSHNNGWVGEYKGKKMMFAQRDDIFLAFYSMEFTGKMSCGYSGYSDGWQDLKQNKKMTYEFQKVTDGNIALTSEIIPKTDGSFNIYISFGYTLEEAALKVIKSANEDWKIGLADYIQGWKSYISTNQENRLLKERYKLDSTSLFVIKSHVSKEPLQGAIIASLSIPWGFSKGDDDLGGYHLIWPRDMVEAAQALLILGDVEGAISALKYLQATQESDGHWPQNMWLKGSSYWSGIQMDETAFPIILLYDLWKKGHVQIQSYRNMFEKAIEFIIKNGPVTDQDRWEEDGGYSNFTISVEVCALCYAAEIANSLGLKEEAIFAQTIADIYTFNIEKWTYRTNSELAQKYGVKGHYVRISSTDEDSDNEKDTILIKNTPWSNSTRRVEDVISTGTLSLARFGLRRFNDEKILNTVKVIDGELKSDTVTGPIWHRYNGDGYGEQWDGSAFNRTGQGRGWPLLAGERANYEILAGNMGMARQLLKTMENQTNFGGMIPEQVWDAEDISTRELYNGKPSGSAMPLVWAHAEYIKLCWALENGHPYDQSDVVYERYVLSNSISGGEIWSFKNKLSKTSSTVKLILIVEADCFVRYTMDSWSTMKDVDSINVMGEIHSVIFEEGSLKNGSTLEFTFFWKQSNRWEGINYQIKII
jgi:glucoamylase